MNKQTSIQIIGGGNVATHLHRALSGKYPVALVSSRSFEGFDPTSDVIIISVKDDAIAGVVQKIKSIFPQNSACIVAHTSGSKPISVLDCFEDKAGVFYPLQTFSKEKELDYSKIPFFIEGNSEATFNALSEIARSVSDTVNAMDSDQRIKLHLASVFVCNFVNHLFGIGSDILCDCELNLEYMGPLIKETVEKALASQSPHDVQTGPARRGDSKVMETHIDILKREYPPIYAKIYETVSQSIAERAKSSNVSL